MESGIDRKEEEKGIRLVIEVWIREILENIYFRMEVIVDRKEKGEYYWFLGS